MITVLIICVFIGGFLGVLIMSLMVATSRSERQGGEINGNIK